MKAGTAHKGKKEWNSLYFRFENVHCVMRIFIK